MTEGDDDEPERAVVYVPDMTDHAAWAQSAAACMDRLAQCGYDFGGIVRRWDDAIGMTRGGRAQVVIVASLGDLPPDRRPRVEVAGDPVEQPRTDHCVVPPAALSRRRARRVR